MRNKKENMALSNQQQFHPLQGHRSWSSWWFPAVSKAHGASSRVEVLQCFPLFCGRDGTWSFYRIQWILLGQEWRYLTGQGGLMHEDGACLFLDLRSIPNWIRVNCHKINNCNRITQCSPREAARQKERAGSFPVSAFPLCKLPAWNHLPSALSGFYSISHASCKRLYLIIFFTSSLIQKSSAYFPKF